MAINSLNFQPLFSKFFNLNNSMPKPCKNLENHLIFWVDNSMKGKVNPSNPPSFKSRK